MADNAVLQYNAVGCILLQQKEREIAGQCIGKSALRKAEKCSRYLLDQTENTPKRGENADCCILEARQSPAGRPPVFAG